MLFKEKYFWKAYALTMAQVLSLVILSGVLYLLFQISVSKVYPFMEVIQNIQLTGDVTAFSEQFANNFYLYRGFVVQLFVLMFGSIILLSGVLSLFDYMILNKLKNQNFSASKWLFEWFRYIILGLLLLMILHFLFYNVINNFYLLIALLVIAFIYSYIIILMSFKVNMLYGIKRTVLRSILLLIIYISFIFLAIVLTGLLKWFGALITFLLIIFMLLWSKIYLMKKL